MIDCGEDVPSVSMPYAGFKSFLRLSIHQKGKHDNTVCQCPMRALSHFYERTLWDWGLPEHPVSMPYAGFKSFLHWRTENWQFFRKVCQCPIRALSHFYYNSNLLYGTTYAVSMPYAGFKSFLLLFRLENSPSTLLCQCPMRALSHFYYEVLPEIKKVVKCVNALCGL